MVCLLTDSDVGNVSFLPALEISQPIKYVIANGHDKLNRHMIAQAP